MNHQWTQIQHVEWHPSCLMTRSDLINWVFLRSIHYDSKYLVNYYYQLSYQTCDFMMFLQYVESVAVSLEVAKEEILMELVWFLQFLKIVGISVTAFLPIRFVKVVSFDSTKILNFLDSFQTFGESYWFFWVSNFSPYWNLDTPECQLMCMGTMSLFKYKLFLEISEVYQLQQFQAWCGSAEKLHSEQASYRQQPSIKFYSWRRHHPL